MFYLRIYGIGHMVKDHSVSKREILFPISSNGYFDIHHPRDRTVHTKVFINPDVMHWLECYIILFLRQKYTNKMNILFKII